VVANYDPGWTRRARERPLGSITNAVDGHSLVVPYSTKGLPKRAASEPQDTVTTTEKGALVVPYYSNGRAAHARLEPAATLSTRDRLALLVPPDEEDGDLPREQADPVDEETIDACRFRMFSLEEVARAQTMDLNHDGTPYVLEGNRRERMKLLGNGNPPVTVMVLIGRLLASIDESSAA
jgi:hypothetical protein